MDLMWTVNRTQNYGTRRANLDRLFSNIKDTIKL